MTYSRRMFSFEGPAAVFGFAAAWLFLLTSGVPAQDLEITLTPRGSAAQERPLPVGAVPSLTISTRNKGARAVGPISLVAKHEGLAAGNTQGWRLDGGNPATEIARIPAGGRVARSLRVRVERAPFAPAKERIRVEAHNAGSMLASAEIELNVADCVGSYRAKLELLRPNLSQNVRGAAEEMRKSDPLLPSGRLFAATGARRGDLAAAERLAATFASRRGADPEMASEWFRFLILRFSSELNNYTGQAPNPGLCANNYYQIAGYRQGLQPITKRIDAIRLAASNALATAREAAKGEPGETLPELVQRIVKDAELSSTEDAEGSLATLADARATLGNGRRLEPEGMRKLSLVETAAWLDEANRRGQALAQAIDSVLNDIANAHKESCICAF